MGNDGTLVCSQSRCLERWVGHFKGQFSWPSVALHLPIIYKQPKRNIEIGSLSLVEIQKSIANLKQGRAAGPGYVNFRG